MRCRDETLTQFPRALAEPGAGSSCTEAPHHGSEVAPHSGNGFHPARYDSGRATTVAVKVHLRPHISGESGCPFSGLEVPANRRLAARARNPLAELYWRLDIGSSRGLCRHGFALAGRVEHH